MNWIEYNNNPKNKHIGDCVIRAISTIMGKTWEDIYLDLCVDGLMECELPNADNIWGQYLKRNGYKRSILSCDDSLCVTVNDFCVEHPNGKYLICPANHIVAVIDGKYYDIWDSGDEMINYYWEKEI